MKAVAFFTLASAALLQATSTLAQITERHQGEEAEAVHVGEDEAVDGPGVHYGPGYVDPISEYDVPSGLQAILTSNDTKWSYPTAFTRNIVPVRLC